MEDVHPNCTFGCNDVESAKHLLIFCPYAKSVWAAEPNLIEACFYSNTTFLDIFKDWMGKHNQIISIELILTKAWFIWKDRCDRVFEKTQKSGAQLGIEIQGFLDFWSKGKHSILRVSIGHMRSPTWNDAGGFEQGRAGPFAASTAEEAEALGLLQGAKWVVERGLSNFLVEGDCFFYVPRTANIVADTLAKEAKSFSHILNWETIPPSCIKDALEVDKSNVRMVTSIPTFDGSTSYDLAMHESNKKNRLPFRTLYALFIFFSLIIQYLVSCHGCIDTERNALLSVKSALADPAGRLSSWNVDRHRNCCSWDGIICSTESFRVISIDLRNIELENYLKDVDLYQRQPNTSLSGKISPSLLDLTHVQYLDLSFNDLLNYSKIQYQLSKLHNLLHLDISYSPFPGSITTQFANLSSLRYLDVSNHIQNIVPSSLSISTLPFYVNSPSIDWVKELVNLRVLRLNGVDISEATTKKNWAKPISFLADLEELHISDSDISSPVFPIRELLNLSRLSNLQMNFHRNLDSPIRELLNLSRLSNLQMNFHRNLDSPIPTQIANLTSLSVLELAGCDNLYDPVPYLPQLQRLDVRQNYNLYLSFTSMFERQWPKLQALWTSSTVVNETIPSSISNAPMLVSLFASGCSIKGSLPATISSLSKLQYLDLSSNSFTILDTLDLSDNNLMGAIPSCLFQNQNLTILDLSKNNLHGTLPRAFHFDDNHFMSINLSRNFLEGSLPVPSRMNMAFDLSQNQFTGGVPFEVGERLSNARHVLLSSNQLSGRIPLSFCSNYKALQSSISIHVLDLSNNTLTGNIPSSLGNCSSLTVLHLGMNNLTGEVPKELAQITMIYLLLHDNLLKGTFPKFIKKFEQLNVLTSGNNNFEGNLPTFFANFPYLRILSLRSNKFNGSIPKEISNLQNLQILDLSNNNFSGPFHGKIGNMAMLRSRPNDTFAVYSGGWRIPDYRLEIVIKGVPQYVQRVHGYNSGIDLSNNIIDGYIPQEIGLLKGLAMLNLSHNHFHGKIPSSVGNMTGLESLDLSFNKLSGEIPMELASASYLGYLNLSYNNLSGRVPEDVHFQGLGGDGSAFLGNELLCGVPTKKRCDGDPIGPTSSGGTGDNTNLHVTRDEDGARDKMLLLVSVILGVGVGFWGLFLGLLCRKNWWFGYWRVVDTVAGKIGGCIKKKV
ncbi:receptor-like protein 9DC3 [Papaver somniferum]|uniref:receptor-like protein 9DC3 n=1 Tax=Papaver somniferum TaxID=3469 RepID=UPI000E70202B|nr:receptor-like protein 9DC3 [Papaver somniferum]